MVSSTIRYPLPPTEYSALLFGERSSQVALLCDTAPIKLVEVCNPCLKTRSGVVERMNQLELEIKLISEL
jgi:hypothetical protein